MTRGSALAALGARPRLWAGILGGGPLLALVAALCTLPVAAWLGAFERWIASLGLWGIALFAVIYVLAAIALAPEWPLMIVAGLAYGIWGVPLVLVVATIAAAVAFLLARHAVRDRVRALIAGRTRLAAVDAAVAEEGWKIVALMRLNPMLPFSLQSYVFGATAVSFRKFVSATALGIIPGTALYVYLGVLGGRIGRGEGAVGAAQWALLGLGLIATAVAVVLVARKAKARLAAAGLVRPRS